MPVNAKAVPITIGGHRVGEPSNIIQRHTRHADRERCDADGVATIIRGLMRGRKWPSIPVNAKAVPITIGGHQVG